ncbi:Hypothetical predicted protein [Mytilus galloprovincialis]|uniref:C1q domain-containing protein n=2 Tax=Mytilus galloprovincialis TaxID=29158 RepID=A0A8B6F9H4_MYTGA|nr:Hypothetical predicted protein [Mytilus galloprovincialis]
MTRRTRAGEGEEKEEEKVEEIRLSTSKAIKMTTILTGILFVSMCLASTDAFSYSLQSGSLQVGVGNKVKYSKEIYTGSGYDPNTGIFTVTVPGIYLISVTMMSGFSSAHLTVRKGPAAPGLILGWLFTDRSFNEACLTIDISLVVDDTIYVQMNSGSDLFDVYNTFSVSKIADP